MTNPDLGSSLRTASALDSAGGSRAEPAVPLARWEWLVAVGAAIAWAIAFRDLQADDAYVTYRYAQNAAGGHGLVFNPGERVMGSTAPGHMLIATAVYALAGLERTPVVMTMLGALMAVALAPIARLLLAPAVGLVAARTTSLALLVGLPGQAGFVSLETPWVSALVLGLALCLHAGRPWLGAVLGALALTFRLDSALFVGPLWLLGVTLRTGPRAGPTGLLLLLGAAWPAFATGYFGSPLPNTLIKMGWTPATEYARSTLLYLASTLLPLGQLAQALPWLALPLLGLSGWGAAALWRAWWMRGLLLGSVAHLGAYIVLRPHTAFTWHIFPVMLVGTLTVFSALGPALRSSAAVRASVSATVAVVLIAGAARWVRDVLYAGDGYWFGARNTVYRQAAEYLVSQGARRIGTHEIGVLGYYGGFYICDLAGLVTKRTDEPLQFDWLVATRSMQRLPPGPPEATFASGDFGALVYRRNFGVKQQAAVTWKELLLHPQKGRVDRNPP